LNSGFSSYLTGKTFEKQKNEETKIFWLAIRRQTEYFGSRFG